MENNLEIFQNCILPMLARSTRIFLGSSLWEPARAAGVKLKKNFFLNLKKVSLLSRKCTLFPVTDQTYQLSLPISSWPQQHLPRSFSQSWCSLMPLLTDMEGWSAMRPQFFENSGGNTKINSFSCLVFVCSCLFFFSL